MNPPTTNRRIGPDAVVPALWPRPGDSPENPLTGEDLISDLDPGWLDWSEEQTRR